VRTASTLGRFAVRPGDGCAAGRQRVAAALAQPVPPDHEVTVRLERRVGPNDERVAASTLTAASTYRGQGIVLRDEDGRLTTSPTGDARC
jgi:hypothetical protein